jgi:hypothetical protein
LEIGLVFDRPTNYLAATLQAESFEQIVNVRFRRRQPDVEPAGDILITQPGTDQLNDLQLACSEPQCRGGVTPSITRRRHFANTVEQGSSHTTGAGLLASHDLCEKSTEVREGGGTRNVACHTGFGPRDYVLLRLHNVENDDPYA